MPDNSWFGWFKRKRDRKNGGPRRLFAPQLEVLEDRALLSAYTVSNLGDSGPGSLRQAILNANSHVGLDNIRFAVTGTINLASTSAELDITDSLNVQGPGAGNLTVNGGGFVRVFAVKNGAKVNFDGLTIANGKGSDIDFLAPALGIPFTGGGGILVEGGAVQVDHSVFFLNTANGGFLTPSIPLGSAGGAILAVGSSSSVSIDHSEFDGNLATGSYPVGAGHSVGSLAAGGAVAEVLGATTTIDHSSFTGNQAVGLLLGLGGAVAADAGSVLHVDHSDFTNNVAADVLGTDPTNPFQGAAGGGAITAGGGAQATVDHSTFDGNTALGGSGPGATGGQAEGGAVFVTADSLIAGPAPSSMTIDHSLFLFNAAQGGSSMAVPGGDGAGGALQNNSSQLTVNHSLFAGNNAVGGQGGSGQDGGSGKGGAINMTTAIAIVLPTMNVSQSTFTNNMARGGDGGMDGGDAQGGAIRIFTGTASVNNDVLAANHAIGGDGGPTGNGGMGLGGGIFNGPGDPSTSQPAAQLDLNEVAIVGNSAAGGDTAVGGTPGLGVGGGLFNLGNVKTKKTIIFGNSADIDPDLFG